jgi:uroporphyrin-III C-methyltransferase/precorrin-2 dehydrogenase/sirohydrochlorin ferrochelatase
MPDTPVLIIENGTRTDERRTLADLSTLEAVIAAAPPQGPALLIIGEVASLYAPEVAGLIETAQQVNA